MTRTEAKRYLTAYLRDDWRFMVAPYQDETVPLLRIFDIDPENLSKILQGITEVSLCPLRENPDPVLYTLGDCLDDILAADYDNFGDVQNTVFNIVASALPNSAQSITLDSHLANDLGADSICHVDIATALSGRFNLSICPSQIERMTTARTLVHLVIGQLCA